MPYIESQRRYDIGIMGNYPETAGELNYQITLVIKDYMAVKGLSYSTINDIVGALEGAKLEFYRRVAVPYEDSKIEQNGDVYPEGVFSD